MACVASKKKKGRLVSCVSEGEREKSAAVQKREGEGPPRICSLGGEKRREIRPS